MPEPTDTRPMFGRTKYGNLPALLTATLIGLLLAVVAASLQVLSNPPGPAHWAAIAILAFCLSGPFIGLAWAFLVDRSTIRGATTKPKLSIESQWSTSAGAAAFYTMLLIGGIASTAATYLGHDDIALGLAALLACGMVSYIVSYFFHKARS